MTHGKLAHPCHMESWECRLPAPALPTLPFSVSTSGQADMQSGAKGEAGEVGRGQAMQVCDEGSELCAKAGMGHCRIHDSKDAICALGASFGSCEDVWAARSRAGLRAGGHFPGCWLQESRTHGGLSLLTPSLRWLLSILQSSVPMSPSQRRLYFYRV